MTREELQHCYEVIKPKDLLKIHETLGMVEYDKIHKVMEFLNWGWASTNGNVPSVEDIKESFKDRVFSEVLKFYTMYESGENPRWSWSSSGGISVKVINYEDPEDPTTKGDIDIIACFMISEANSFE